MATVESPPLLRHSTTATKLDIQTPSSSSPPRKLVNSVPEFMQIQLNRVDTSRPKSCIEYSSHASSTLTLMNATSANHHTSIEDDKERRFSNESIEISDRKKVGYKYLTPPPKIFAPLIISFYLSTQRTDDPPVMLSASHSNIYSQNLNKSTESLRSAFGRQSRTSSGSQQLSRGSSASDLNRTIVHGDNQSGDEYLDDSDNGSDTNVVVERRKSVSDKKLQFEQKIEKIQEEVKRSSIMTMEKTLAKKPPLDEDVGNGAVVLRNKKSSKSSGRGSDATPELMKVFARRSLKIKDTDEYLVNDEAERDTLNQKLGNDTNNNAVSFCFRFDLNELLIL